ncbi:leukocyte surface antigen CD53 isoform X2 [Hyperolius riggenbachi]|uniref:leukocyte surface antigen CD53 isoform X2 n=1 Tax=Hyperolius riggenbachi TaxID=752182 RepID=UPI0035A31359
MSKCIKVLKYLLFCFNLLFWAIGCSIIAIGIYFVVHNIYGSMFPNAPSLTVGNVLILFGCVIMVFGFVGCMGAIKENKCLLLTFFILLLLILLAEVIMAIILFVYEKEVEPYVTKHVTNSFEEFKTQNKKNETIWHEIQRSMHCCGINGSADWGNSIPASCCPTDETPCSPRTAFKLVLGMSFALTLYCHISRSSGSLSTK